MGEGATEVDREERRDKKMERFSVDESGYTGADLLNDEQRWQGASALSITDDDATRLIKEHFPKLQAPELKYSSIGKRTGYQEPLLNLLRDALKDRKAVTYVCDKRFLLMLMYVDHAVEPYYHRRGFNLYADGANYSMASLMNAIGPTMLGPDVFAGIMAAFQRAVKEKSKEAIDDLIAKVRASKWETTFAEGFGPIAEAHPECLSEIASQGVSTDAAFVVRIPAKLTAVSDEVDRVESRGAWGSDFSVVGQHRGRF